MQAPQALPSRKQTPPIPRERVVNSAAEGGKAGEDTSSSATGRLFAERGGQPGRQGFSATASLLSLRTKDGTEVSSLLSRSFYQQQYLGAHCFSTERQKSEKFPDGGGKVDPRRGMGPRGELFGHGMRRSMAQKEDFGSSMVRPPGAIQPGPLMTHALEVLVRHAILPTLRDIFSTR